MPLETLLSPPFFGVAGSGVAGSLSFSNTRVASHKTMEAPKGAVCPKCGTPITKMEHSLDDPQEFEYYCPRCRKWYHYVEFQLQQYQEVSGFCSVSALDIRSYSDSVSHLVASEQSDSNISAYYM